MVEIKKITAAAIFDGEFFLPEKSVLIISQTGEILDVVAAAGAGDDVEMFEGIISPGFINCHCHLELSYLKNKIDEATGLIGFLKQVVNKREAAAEIIIEAIAKADEEMFENGIVAVGDICNTPNTILQKQSSKIYYHSFVEVFGSKWEEAATFFERGKNIYQQFKTQSVAPLACSLVPHAPYSLSAELWNMVIGFNPTEIATIHNQEAAAENEWFENKTGAFEEFFETLLIDQSLLAPSGKTSLQHYLPTIQKNRKLLLVHNVATSVQDIFFAQKNGFEKLFWCLCPNANWFISRTMPNVEQFVQLDCNICIGTDSYASNHSLNILSELKRIEGGFKNVSLTELLKWGTYNGAKALGIEEKYGRLKPGMQPGLILLNKTLETVKRLI